MSTEADQTEKPAKRRGKSAVKQLVTRLTIPTSHSSYDELKNLATDKERRNRILFLMELGQRMETFAKMGIACQLTGLPQDSMAVTDAVNLSSPDQSSSSQATPVVASGQHSQEHHDRAPALAPDPPVKAAEEAVPVFDLDSFN
jgi:hypothetical protein